MVLNIKSYIKTRENVSLSEILEKFDIDTRTLVRLLDNWISKGRVMCVYDNSDTCPTKKCGMCVSRCNSYKNTNYRWIES